MPLSGLQEKQFGNEVNKASGSDTEQRNAKRRAAGAASALEQLLHEEIK